jgi:hypothetical protein
MITRREIGGREGIRTPDPLLAKQVLCQLSYTPTEKVCSDSKAFPFVPGVESFPPSASRLAATKPSRKSSTLQMRHEPAV